MGVLERAIRWYETGVTRAGLVAAIALYTLVLVVCLDVIFRKFFKAPFLWTAEFAGFGLLMVGMLGAAYTLIAGGHIKLDLVVTKLPPRARAITDLCAGFFSLVYLAVFCFVTSLQAWESIGETTSIMLWPVSPFKFLLPIASGLLGLGIAIEMGRGISKINPGAGKDP